MSVHALELQHVNKSFDGFELKDISFRLPKGYIMGLVGPNGAGKSTTIKSILNTVNIKSGSIKVMGQDTRKGEAAVKSQVAYVSDSCIFSEAWTVKNIAFILRNTFPSWNSRRFQDFTDEFGLPWNKQLREFSRGMKLKTMLAAALSRETSLLFLDEPTAGLDPVMRDRFLQLMQEYVSDGEHSVLFSTHITTDLEKIADFITFIHDGQLLFTGETQVLKERYCLVKGSPEELEQLPVQPVGLRRFSYGFEALIQSQDIRLVPSAVLVEPATLDEIVVFHALKREEGTRSER